MNLTTLHSTMFLLILFAHHSQSCFEIFTFHNVSINTALCQICHQLITFFTFHNVSINTPIDGMFCKQFTAFTFHNVSINTQSWLQGFGYKENFTFHNVSINTESPDGQQVSDILYIPQCFY